MNSTLTLQLLLQVILIMLNAVFACAEIAVISVKNNKLESFAANGNKRAIKLLKLKNEPSSFLATIQIAITLSGFLGSAFAADNFSKIIVNKVISAGINIPVSFLESVSVILITVILSYFTLVFGELVPKRIAMKKAEQISLRLSSMIYFISIIFSPVVKFLTTSVSLILRFFGINDNESEDENISESDIREMAIAGSLNGVIGKEENEIIQNIFEFDDISIGKIVTHRTEVDVLMLSDKIEKWDNIIHKTRHSHYIICNENIDDVYGVLNAKDYFRLNAKTKEEILKKAVKSPYFVPANMKSDKLFEIMKKTKNHFSVVLDEYGGFLGIITMNDLLEQLVGNLDNYDDGTSFDNNEIIKFKEDKWFIKGSVSLLQVEKELNISLPTDEFDTFGGFIISLNQVIPNENEKIEIVYEGYKIVTAPLKNHKIISCIISKIL